MASVVAVAVCVILQIRMDRPPPVVLFGAVISAALAVLWCSRLEPWDTCTGYIATERQFILLRGSGEPALTLPKRAFPDTALVAECRRLLEERPPAR